MSVSHPIRIALLVVSQKQALIFYGIEMYKISHNNSPRYLSKIFIRRSESLRWSSRLAVTHNVVVPIHRTEAHHNSFHMAGVFLWNSSPSDSVAAGSIT